MRRILPLILLLVAILAVPFLFRPEQDVFQKVDRTLVIITPHNEAIRFEFAQAFARHMKAKTGETVRIDWRTPGGVSEITKFIASEYFGAFENYWRNHLKRRWTPAVAASFDNGRIKLDDTPADDTPEEAARRAFLSCDAGIGIDVFFGGGSFDFSQQAEAGRLVDCGAIGRHPELFNPTAIPQSVGGEAFWDPKGRWVGVCLGAFGICYNNDVLARLKIPHPPERWADLADPQYEREIALTDPTKSGSAAKAFEMLIQQQIHEAGGDPVKGWENAMRLLQRIAANARYFTDAGSKPAIDVSLGDAAAGMVIDFYGRFQSEAVRKPDGTSRMGYITPRHGSSTGSDPIGLLRGAKNRDLAIEFIEFTLTPEAQKLWNYKVGAPGGPEKYALRRLPILPELYKPEYAKYRSDPEVDAYRDAADFQYNARWTGPLFNPIRFVVRAMCLDPADELHEAWRALIENNFPPQATAAFNDVSAVSYEICSKRVREVLASKNKVAEVQLAKELGDNFRANYRRAADLAREQK